jgi:hypothetical protein
MARKKTTSSVIAKPRRKSRVSKEAKALKAEFLKNRRISKGLLLTAEAGKPVNKKRVVRKSTAKKAVSLVAAPKTKSVAKRRKSSVTPACSTAGRKLKTIRSSAAGRKLSSPSCKPSASRSTTKRKSTTKRVVAKRSTSVVKAPILSVGGGAKKKSTKGGLLKTIAKNLGLTPSAKRSTAKRSTAKRSTGRKSSSSAASKLARVRKVVC